MQLRHSVLFILAFIPCLSSAHTFLGGRWNTGETTFYVDFIGAAPSGITWNEAFEDAMAQWSEQTDFNFLINPTYVDPCAGFIINEETQNSDFPVGAGDATNGADFSDDVCGIPWDVEALAITVSLFESGPYIGFLNLSQTDILFNNAFQWDIYTGPVRVEQDFRRIALHELGHALGLDHENEIPSMMAERIGDIETLQDDDITGANTLYGGPMGECEITDINVNTVIENSLADGDCAVFELYGGGDDTSFVDTYRLTLNAATDLNILMESASLDSILVLTDNKLKAVEFDDDSGGKCDALISGEFAPGEYLLLANTFVAPFKCQGNTGGYKISITDNTLPILSNARSSSGQDSKSIFHGGATTDDVNYKSSFLPSESIKVNASIQPDPAHIGQSAALYVVAVLSTGQTFVKMPSGKFKAISSLADLPAFSVTGSLKALENIAVVSNLKGDSLGASGLTFNVYVGYSLDSSPGEIFFNGDPIAFTIQ